MRDNGTLVEKLEKIEKSLNPTLVRRKEQIKGIVWFLETGLKRKTNREILYEVKKRFLT